MQNNVSATPSQSKILPVVVSGFALISLAIVTFWLISGQQMKHVENVLSESAIIAKKMDIVASMTDVSRTRSRLTMQMIYTDDFFDRDEIGLLLNTKATEFVVLRQQLFDLGVTRQEQDILDEQSVYIKFSLQRQRFAVYLAMGDNLERDKATDIVVNEVYPSQSVVVDYFMKMLKFQKKQLDDLAASSLFRLKKNASFNKLVQMLIFVGLLGIILFMLKNIRRIENQIILEKEKAQVTLRSIGDGVITTNYKGEIEYLNQVALDFVDETSSHLVGRNVNELFDKNFQASSLCICDCIQHVLHDEDKIEESSEILFSLVNKPSLTLKANVSPIVDVHHKVTGVVISFHDITESQALLKKIQHQASHDTLTGLLNRRAFEEKVNQMLRLYDSAYNHAFCILDLDQFKIVNDSAGHAAGDELLRQLAKVMQPVLRKSDLLSRLGGDEFGIFLSNLTSGEALKITEKLLTAVQSFGFYWEDNVYRVGASIGVINVPGDIIDYEYLYQAADSACYIAKNEGRNQIHVMPIDGNILHKKAEESELLQYLTKTLKDEQFYLYGQNIEPISARSAGRKHIEVLLRMKDKHGTLISPMAFIPLAERYGLMANIDLWVLKQVCQLINSTPQDKTVYAVNLSGQSLSSKEHMKEMLMIFLDCQIPPGRLCLEVTETVAIANLDNACNFMATLRDHGCFIALDDFGSGLSSFSYLKTLPLDYIKIDGVFIKSMDDDKTSGIMIEAIHNIGKKLGLFTVAEYVETESSVIALKEIGIDMAQGYYFDKPHELIAPRINQRSSQTSDH
ncbi:MAG: EAL domain-containing protein [Thiotrichaceae bacterium]|nr:EAL domain-containing protein [Thiotrichaceae bacterium]